ncbi:uncharacterized protein LOC144701690 [Wolffia australiana]
MEDEVDKGKAKCEDVPVPAEILIGILQQLKAMNSKLEVQPATTSRRGPADPSRHGRVQVTQEPTAEQKPIFRKGDLPYFNGTNAQAWLNCVERFFKIHKLTDDEKLQLVSLHMEGIAQGWFIYTEENFGSENWLGFCHYFEKRYNFSVRSLCTQLMNLRQKGTVSEYRSEFEDLVAFLAHVPHDIQETAYLNGLKREIRVELNKYRPFGIQDIMDYSLEAESNLAILDEQGGQTRVITTIPRILYNNNNQRSMGIIRGEGRPHPPQNREAQNSIRNESFQIDNKKKITKLTTEEFIQRKEKGLCYTCNEKYTPGHRCNKKLSIYMLQEDVEEEEDQPITEENLMQLDDGPLIRGEFMSINSSKVDTGLSPASFRLWGELYNPRVSLLIDGGATYNFIKPKVIQALSIQVSPYHKFSISLGDGFRRMTEGICLNIPITFQELNSLRYSKFEVDQTHQEWEESIQHINEIKEQAIIHPQEVHSLSLDHYLHGLETIFPHVFENPKSLPPVRSCDHQIHLLPDSKPINKRPYRYSYSHKNILEELMQELLEINVIRHSNSCFTSPALLVKKKDGGFRLCIAYRSLNQMTIPNRFPIPMVDELLEELHGMTIFYKIYLKSVYYQIRMHSDDIYKTAFKTHHGHFEFQVIPFGLSKAPATFQALMNSIFSRHLCKFILVFFDDILVYSTDSQQHEQHLKIVFELLSRNHLHINPKKCMFGCDRIDFLGHGISAEGVSTDPTKIEAIQQWSRPATVKELRGFLGLTGYYRQFVSKYEAIAQPLTALLKKNSFVWTDEAEDSFRKLKQALSETPVRRLPNFSKPFSIETDASETAVGAVLLKENHPIAYFSKAFNCRTRFKSAYEQELMAVVWAIQNGNTI